MTDDNQSHADIVVVEDQPDLAEIYKTRMTLLDFSCAIAGDGLQALIEIEKRRPRLVLLDLMMPKLSGEQVLKVLRSTDWGKDVKVLIISNLNEADAPADLRDLGIEGYLVKANLTEDQVDKIVTTILKPVGQQVDASLEGSDENVVTPPKDQ